MTESRDMKWGWDGERTHHWPSREHAQHTHRQDFAKLIGREPSLKHGDVLGHATYLPEERTDEDRVKAPETVVLHSLYNSEIPEGVFDHFRSVFPKADIRRGHAHEKTPTRHEAAIVDWTKPVSGADWAREFWGRTRDMFIDGKEVVTESIYPELNTEWMKVSATEADMSGAMLAFFLPEEVGKKIQIEGGEPLEQLHTTLIYFDDKADERDDWDKVVEIAKHISDKYGALEGKISGFGVFKNPDGDVLWAYPDMPRLAEFRHELLNACELAGFDQSPLHGWSPHITLKYGWDSEETPFPDLDEPIPLMFDKLTFARGDDHQHAELPEWKSQ